MQLITGSLDLSKRLQHWNIFCGVDIKSKPYIRKCWELFVMKTNNSPLQGVVVFFYEERTERLSFGSLLETTEPLESKSAPKQSFLWQSYPTKRRQDHYISIPCCPCLFSSSRLLRILPRPGHISMERNKTYLQLGSYYLLRAGWGRKILLSSLLGSLAGPKIKSRRQINKGKTN